MMIINVYGHYINYQNILQLQDIDGGCLVVTGYGEGNGMIKGASPMGVYIPDKKPHQVAYEINRRMRGEE
jgi:hypothetical protein